MSPPTMTMVESPYMLYVLRSAMEIAKQKGDHRRVKLLEDQIKHASTPIVVVRNYLGMEYCADVHGPARRLSLGYNFDFVYWDAKLGGENLLFGCTVMPSHLLPTTPYDWRIYRVKVFSIDFSDRAEEITSGYTMTVTAGQRLLIKVPTDNMYVTRLVMVQPEAGPLPVLMVARY